MTWYINMENACIYANTFNYEKMRFYKICSSYKYNRYFLSRRNCMLLAPRRLVTRTTSLHYLITCDDSEQRALRLWASDWAGRQKHCINQQLRPNPDRPKSHVYLFGVVSFLVTLVHVTSAQHSNRKTAVVKMKKQRVFDYKNMSLLYGQIPYKFNPLSADIFLYQPWKKGFLNLKTS